MKKVKFTQVNNQKLLSVFARYRGIQAEKEAPPVVASLPPEPPQETPLAKGEETLPRPGFKVNKLLPRTRRIVFSTGRRLFMPAQAKEIKIRFVLNK